MNQNYVDNAVAVLDPNALVQPARRAAVAFIFVTCILDTLSFGIALPVLPELIRQIVGGGFSQAAWWFGIYGAVFAAAQFLFSPVQGALSDRFGRRPVILMSNFGMALNYVMLALVSSLWWLPRGARNTGNYRCQPCYCQCLHCRHDSRGKAGRGVQHRWQCFWFGLHLWARAGRLSGQYQYSTAFLGFLRARSAQLHLRFSHFA